MDLSQSLPASRLQYYTPFLVSILAVNEAVDLLDSIIGSPVLTVYVTGQHTPHKPISLIQFTEI